MATDGGTGTRVVSELEMDSLDRFYVSLKKFYYVIGMIGEWILFGLMMLTVVHCLGRYFFKKPVPGLVELSCWLLIVGIFLLMSYTQSLKGHIIVDLIYSKWPKRRQALAAIIHYIIILVLIIPATYYSAIRALYLRTAGNVSMILQFAYWPVTMMVAVGWLLLSVIFVAQLMIMIRDYRRGSSESAKTTTAAV